MAPKKPIDRKPRGKAVATAMTAEESKERAKALREANCEHVDNLARVRTQGQTIACQNSVPLAKPMCVSKLMCIALFVLIHL